LIPQETISKIFDAADIVEVISDFIILKKSGSNYKGLSPFSNEKTPSFMVSPGKRIFKDFSSGKGGNVISFLMDHEHLSYPEALKWLANKYNIEITEEEETEEQQKNKHNREALYLAHQYANEFFKNELNNTDEGKSIGISYFKKRGYSLKTIDYFELGYSPNKIDAISKKAKSDNYNTDSLLQSGVIKKSERGTYDFFRGRVIFPIHNISGRVIGFGARTLRSDKKVAKYFNSPESIIYNKSQVLYGLFQAKNEIIKNNCCFLVEGYTDVISLHQNSIKNTVASSGTSLTDGQIRLIKRFTSNIVILYDGDEAGINASFRGVDMILAAGLNVKIIVFPVGEDPDSYSNKLSTEDFKTYLAENQNDFISFKANHLLEKTKDDPINVSKTINEIITSISVIPDAVARSVYIKTTAQIFEMDEQLLILEVQKKIKTKSTSTSVSTLETNTKSSLITAKKFKKGIKHDLNLQERDLIRLMLNYGSLSIPLEVKKNNGEIFEEEYPLAQFIIEEILTDNLFYNNENYQLIFNEFIDGLENGLLVNENHFIQNPNLTSIIADLTTSENIVSENWKLKHQIHTKTEPERLKQAAVESVFIYKLRVTENLILDKQERLKSKIKNSDEDVIIKEIQELTKVRNIFAKKLGIIVTQ
tara:strand:- start:16789 stop:18729 length:1941 start_codon:yes stop_codon:yes gene_type:complete